MPASKKDGRRVKKAIGSCRIGTDSRAFMVQSCLIRTSALQERICTCESKPGLCRLLLVLAVQFCTNAFGQLPALSPLLQTGTLIPPANSTQFTFVIAGDNRPAHSRIARSRRRLETSSALYRAMNPPAAFVLWTGDTISGKAKHPKHAKDARRSRPSTRNFWASPRRAGVPVFNAPGNHEMDDQQGNVHPRR